MQFYDLLNIFELNGLPSEENPYLFNGDFVDRGSFSLEVILTLFAFKCMSPSGGSSCSLIWLPILLLHCFWCFLDPAYLIPFSHVLAVSQTCSFHIVIIIINVFHQKSLLSIMAPLLPFHTSVFVIHFACTLLCL